MSAGYFGDLVKKHTGDSAKGYIHHFIIQKAKSLLASGETISAAAYDLGFDYPQHLSRLFKKKEGISYRSKICSFVMDYYHTLNS